MSAWKVCCGQTAITENAGVARSRRRKLGAGPLADDSHPQRPLHAYTRDADAARLDYRRQRPIEVSVVQQRLGDTAIEPPICLLLDEARPHQTGRLTDADGFTATFAIVIGQEFGARLREAATDRAV